jgi:hypothetical protein
LSGTADLCALRHKNINIEREKLDNERRHALGASVCVSLFERKIASDNVALVLQSLTQSSVAHLGPASTDRDVANLRYRWSLRARRKRPYHHAAENCNELASSHISPKLEATW